MTDIDHPIANVFPLMGGEALEDLVLDIKRRGLQHAIVMHENRILDGRNRYRACLEADITPQFVDFAGDDPLAYVLSSNLHRRHLSESQRAMVAARVATLPAHRPSLQDKSAPVPSSSGAAHRLGVSTRSVTSARAVLKRAVPELVKAVERGSLPLKVAAAATKCSPEDQRDIAAATPSRASTVVKQRARQSREAELSKSAARAGARLGSMLYGVIYADPPWRFEPYSRVTGLDRAADNHYPTMTLDDICAIAVLAAEDAVLFLWATVPMLEAALGVMAAWGFAYRSHFAWVKDRAGTGYWTRNQHELLLVGTRGKIPAPAPGDQHASVINDTVGLHSAKPPSFAEIIEKMFPSARRLEMFARVARQGWDTWGNEAPAALQV